MSDYVITDISVECLNMAGMDTCVAIETCTVHDVICMEYYFWQVNFLF